MTRRVPWSDEKNARFAKAWTEGVAVHDMQARFGFTSVFGVYKRQAKLGLPNRALLNSLRVVAVKGEK